MNTKRIFQIIAISIAVHWVIACSSRTTPAPVVDIGAGKTFSRKSTNSIDSNTYVVAKGDTLFSIAWYANKDFKTLARINNISEPYRIYPNQTLLLKAPANQAITKKSQKHPKKPDDREIITPKSNKVIDRKKKQAYGNNTKVAQQGNANSNTSVDWQWPSSGKLISRFSLTEKGNKGIDLAGKLGSPILATANGKVVYTGNALRGYGNLVIVKHDEDYLSAYAHNDEILVKEQQRVQTGQTIARMGNSGAQRTKLHFEIRYKGKSVDPLRYLPKQNNNK